MNNVRHTRTHPGEGGQQSRSGGSPFTSHAEVQEAGLSRSTCCAQLRHLAAKRHSTFDTGHFVRRLIAGNSLGFVSR